MAGSDVAGIVSVEDEEWVGEQSGEQTGERVREQISEQTWDRLKGLRALARELEASFGAIAANNLSEFEEIVARQESLCAALTRGSEQGRTNLRTPKKPTVHQVSAALSSLERLNYSYAALIHHSGRSIQLLASLSGSYRGQSYDRMRVQKNLSSEEAVRLNHPTWDCEM